MRVAMIGCGDIAQYHVQALRGVGLIPTAVCSRPGSLRVRDFARRHGIPRIFPGVSDLLRNERLWDALVIAVSPEATFSVLQQALSVGKPILVEKPVSVRSQDLEPMLGNNLPVIVGYNRRFYPPVLHARALVRGASAPWIGHMMVSETVARDDSDSPALKRFIYNGVHAVDVLRFVCGEVEPVHVERVYDSAQRLVGLQVLLKPLQMQGSVTITAVWNTPANVALNLYGDERRICLEPYELAVVYETMRRVDPTPDVPIRRYVPVPAAEVGLDDVDKKYKPGMLRQAQALKELVSGNRPQMAATLEDAYRNLQLVERLFDATWT